MPDVDKNSIVITGLGMLTAVGRNALSSCASLRAGIVRAAELDYFTSFSEEENDQIPVVGYIASRDAVGAEGFGKMLALGTGALEDLLQSCKVAYQDLKSRAGIYIALPNYSLRQETYIDVDQKIKGGWKNDLSSSEEEEDIFECLRFSSECNERLIKRLFETVGFELNIVAQRITYGDQCNFLMALKEAINDLEFKNVDRCIVGGIDSYLEPSSLEWAIEKNRLRFEGSPCGFFPGEGAVFIQIEKFHTAIKTGVEVSARLTCPEFDQEKESVNSGNPPTGMGLASAIRKSIVHNRVDSIGLIIGDRNGETTSARDWGCALAQLTSEFPTLREARTLYPAESFGYAGCASTGMAIGVGIQAFKRNYARTNDILIWCSSERSHRGSVILSNME